METTLLNQLKQVVSRFPIQQAYLFGSHARGTATVLSDIDLAVLYEPSADSAAVELELFAEISQQLKTDNIDIIDIATASPLLAHRAVLRGISILAHSAHDSAMLKTKILHAYEDTRHLREIKQRAFI